MPPTISRKLKGRRASCPSRSLILNPPTHPPQPGINLKTHPIAVSQDNQHTNLHPPSLPFPSFPYIPFSAFSLPFCTRDRKRQYMDTIKRKIFPWRVYPGWRATLRRCWLSVCGSYPGWGKKPNGGIEEQGAGVMAGGE